MSNFTETGSGGIAIGSCFQATITYSFDLVYGPGDIVFNREKAITGCLERIAIKSYRIIGALVIDGRKMPNIQVLYYDTFNDVWNESDLVDQETAIALAVGFYENQIEQLNSINCPY